MLDTPEYHGKIRSQSPKGEAVCGLSYEEAIQYAWIETDDAGQFVSGEKLPPPPPPGTPVVYPPFLRKR
ncbi:MAG: hypothetical protein LBK55_00805 [Azoarcus sp.]|nr:hypothetical protein [Azoarcus sp.]